MKSRDKIGNSQGGELLHCNKDRATAWFSRNV